MNWIQSFNSIPKNSIVITLLLFLSASIVISLSVLSCKNKQSLTFKDPDANIIFLHHSTGNNVWNGGSDPKPPRVVQLMKKVNEEKGKKYAITEQSFPKSEPYGWNNYPFDYYNIWVKHGGAQEYKKEPTLENLTKNYDVIIFKHCFPVSNIMEDTGKPNIDSDAKRLENYKLQYNALKGKMKSFPNTKFIIWTSAALTKAATTEENAGRSRQFVNWVKEEWDEDGDNIFIFDFWQIETEGGLFLKDDYAKSEKDSHPNGELSKKASELFVSRVIDIVENNGQMTKLTGEKKPMG